MLVYLILFGVVVIGSIIWTAMQVSVWTSVLRKGASYPRMKGLLIGSLIGFPIFVEYIGLISTLLAPRNILWSLLIAPGIIAYALGLSLVGLHVAQRVIGSKPKDQANEEAQQVMDVNRP